MWWIIGIAGWIACGAVAYVLARGAYRHVLGRWTAGSRRASLLLAAFGPLFLNSMPVVGVEDWLADDRPANW